MLRNLSWETTDNLARSQFQIYRELGDAMGIGEEDRRRVLLLNQQEWTDWADFLNEGPLPAEPPSAGDAATSGQCQLSPGGAGGTAGRDTHA